MRELAKLIVAAAAKSAAQFDTVAKFESALFLGRRYEFADGELLHPAIKKLLADAGRSVSKAATLDPTFPDPIVIVNIPPYSEAIYFSLWKRIIESSSKLQIQLKPTPWNAVPDDLKNDALSFAIWNDYFADRVHSSQIDQFRRAGPLYTYRDYFLVGNRAFLEDKLRKENFAGAAKSALTDIVSGNAPDPAVWEGDELNSLREVLLSGSRISYVKKSDIERAALKIFPRSQLRKAADKRDLTSDQAIEDVIDGHIGLAIVGAIQCRYTERLFDHRVVRLARIPSVTKVYLYFKGPEFQQRKYNLVLPILSAAWTEVRSLWQNLQDDGSHVRHDRNLSQVWAWVERHMYETGADYVGGPIRTPLRDLEEALEISREHDELHEFKPEARSLQKQTKTKDAQARKSAEDAMTRSRPKLVVSN
jgi:DNA-binding transcriptional LysR family regulator